MSKIATVAVMFCAVLATPALGSWIYDGTSEYDSPPTSVTDPYGTFWYYWNGGGAVDGDSTHVVAEGTTEGRAGVCLNAEQWRGSSRLVRIYSHTKGQNNYHWEGTGNKNLILHVYSTIYYAQPWCIGVAEDDLGTCTADCCSEVRGEGGAYAAGNWSWGGMYYPKGVSYGTASSLGTASAENLPYDVDVSGGDAEWDTGAYWGYYDASMTFSCYPTEPVEITFYGADYDTNFSVYSEVRGEAYAVGHLRPNGQELYAYFYTDGGYYIEGSCEVYLYGDIQ